MIQFKYDQPADEIWVEESDNPGVVRGGPVAGDSGICVHAQTKYYYARENATIPQELLDPLGP